MIAKDYSHENISKRLYTLLTRQYKSIPYRDSEIKRYLQWIVDKNLFTEIENIYLTDEHKQHHVFVYCLSTEFNTIILWHKAKEFNYIFFIKADTELSAYSKYAKTPNEDIFRCKYLTISVLNGRVCVW
ncbi:MAG: hypothetical protein IJR44_06295 [Neisseriaceae bacterium]|nr:hypothetical protein [Neisseriaceae bacterium]